jgi:hypothetical protein
MKIGPQLIRYDLDEVNARLVARNAPKPKLTRRRRQDWRRDGKLHPEDGPAIIYASGAEEWYFESKRRRWDGTAIIPAYGPKYWYV